MTDVTTTDSPVAVVAPVCVHSASGAASIRVARTGFVYSC